MQFLIDRFASAPDKTAFITDGSKFSYSKIVETAAEYTRWLKKNEIRPGEIVAFVGDYSPEIYCFILALALNKNTVVPLTSESVIEKNVVLKIAEAQVFVTFDADPLNPTMERTSSEVENPLLIDFLKKDHAGLILFSSGSTGQPKGILHDFERVAEKFKTARKPSITITFLMLDHFGGINTLLAITSSLGTVVTVKQRSVAAVCKTIQHERVETLPTTPSFLNMMVASGGHRDFDLTSLKLITYGTEVMPQATLEKLRTLFPQAKLQQTYGLSELGVLRSQSRPDGSLWVRVGGEGFQTKVIEDILWIKSAYAMEGYLNAPSPFDSDGWFNTQDRVEVDGDYFRILGRVTDLMNIGGQKVYPAEIEDIVLGLENIQDVAVFAEKHPLLGSIVVAQVVVINPESVAELKKRIRKACGAKLAAFKVPTKVTIAEKSIYSARQKKIRRAELLSQAET